MTEMTQRRRDDALGRLVDETGALAERLRARHAGLPFNAATEAAARHVLRVWADERPTLFAAACAALDATVAEVLARITGRWGEVVRI